MKNKKILVTGGAGFIGSNLCTHLAKNNSVVSLDNYLMGQRDNHVPAVSYVEGSCGDIENIFAGEKFDNIFHFGEYSRVEQSLNEPDIAFQNGLYTFPNVLKFCLSAGSKLTYAASSTKFANNGTGSQLSPYTFFKATNSELIQNYARWYGLKFSSVYFYNAYGEREIETGKYSTVIAKFKSLKRNGATKLPVSQPGTQRRNFTHINDIIKGILLATMQGENDGYGIGADEAYSIVDLCEMFECEPEFYTTNSANRMSAPVNSDKLKALGWQPSMKLQEHIRDFLDNL